MSSPPTSNQQGTPNNQQPANGQRLEDYLILEAIGKGSFGKVKRGVHIPSGQAVAIKILNRQKLKSANMDKKIRREIKILKLFRHPNVCRLYEVITTSTDIFLIMEHVDGGELYDYIVKQGRLREDAARYIFQQIVCALEYCHHFRVVHRDLKPENILLGANLQVKLIDFGLSNLMQDGDFLATSCGSPNYAAPEVISGKLYHGPEVDVWSCGVIMYALLCGCLPFDEETIPLLFSKIKKGKYIIPPHVTAGARALLDQVLAVDPLVRLTVPQIRDNQWFNINIPLHLMFNEAAFESNWDRASAGIVDQVKNVMNAKEKDIRNQIEAGEGRLFVAYQILHDVKRRLDIAKSLQSEGLQTTGSTFTLASPGRVTACQRELNMGLILSMSPAMEVLLDSGDAATNKAAYNSGTYLPASVQQDPTKMLSVTPSSAGTFNISRPSTSVSSSGGLLSSSHQRQLAVGSLRGGGNSSATVAASIDKPRVGSVARTQQMYSAQEEAFVLQNNFGWRVGLMTDFRGPAAMGVLYDILRSMGLEWKTAAQFRLLVRRMGATKDGIVLSMYIFRIQEKHEKGSILDLSVVRGNTFESLDLILAIVEKIHERIG
jgi:5'-AMP-activated protein kinase, catalytic alpha subunit